MIKSRRKKKEKYIPVPVFSPIKYPDREPPTEYQVGDLCEVDNILLNGSLGSGNDGEPNYASKELLLLVEVNPGHMYQRHKFLRLSTQTSGWWHHEIVDMYLKLFASNS